MANRDVNLIIRAKNDASGAFKQVGSALAEMLGVQKKVTQQADEIRRAMKGSEAGAAALASTLSGKTTRAAKQTSGAFDAIENKVKAAQDTFNAQAGKLDKLSSEYDNLEAQVRGAARAVGAATEAINNDQDNDKLVARLKLAEQGYFDLVKAAARAQTEFEQQSAVVRELGVETEALSRRMDGARIAMAAAERVATQKATASASATTGIAKLAAAEERIARASRTAAAAQAAAAKPTRQLVVELLRAAPAADAAARSMLGAGRAALTMRGAFSSFYGDTRQSLSLMQRLRGEVLSLTASLVGFYAILNSGRSVFNAFSEFQAAQNRLGAAFAQNTQLVGRELAYLQGEAERLGITFENLSGNYSKFLISATAANFTTGETRRVFRQVTEAGRVLNLSNDQISGVLTALTQIAGKGTLQMEELRQQLGDRLPGAVSIMARALGYASDELDQFYKDVEDGQIDARTALTAFGEELEETYGAQLSQSLQSVTAEMGRFQDAIFNRQLSAANAGFIDGLVASLQSLTEYLNSAEGVAFFESLGAAAGRLLQVIPLLVENFDTIATLFQIWVSLKVGQVFIGLVGNVRTATGATNAFRLAVRNMDRQIILAGRANAALGVRLRALRPIMIGVASTARAMWVAIGGPIGLIVAALSFFAVDALGGLLTSVNEVDSALREHEDLIGDIQAAYLRAATGASDWADELQNLSAIQLEQNNLRLAEGIAGARDEFSGGGRRLAQMDATLRPLIADIQDQGQLEAGREFLRVSDAFAQGQATAEEYLQAVRDLRAALGDISDESLAFLAAEEALAEQAADSTRAIEENEAAIVVLRLENKQLQETLTDTEAAQLSAAREFLGLTEAADEQGEAVGRSADANERFTAALRELARQVPSLQRELDQFDSIQKIEEAFEASMQAARDLPDAILRIAGAWEAAETRRRAYLELDSAQGDALIGELGLTGSGLAAATRIIMREEGFIDSAEYDVNAYRVGYGSDTTTAADGRTTTPVTANTTTTREAAARDLQRRINEEFMPAVVGAIGEVRFDNLSAAQQGVLTSLAYNYGAGAFQQGEGLFDVGEALRSGASDDEVSAIIRNLSANPQRREREADIFQAGRNPGDADSAALTAEEERARLEQQRIEREAEFRQNQAERIEQMQFELSLEQMQLQDAEVAQALREATLEAQRAGTELTQQEADEIERITRARFAEQAQQEHRNNLLEQARAKEEEVNRLRERRNDLMADEAALAEQGDLLGAANVAEELDGVNVALEEAIENAIRFWEAMGGPESADAIYALQRLQQGLEETDEKVIVTGRQINDMFANKASQAVTNFIQKVQAGEPPLQALGAAFSQMAADILIELGQMIVKQAIFNAISGAFGGGAGGNGGVGGIVSGGINALFNHSGGIVGSGVARKRTVPINAFSNAVKMHSGGMAGLAADEYATVLQKNEEVLTEGNPRHILNQGGGKDGAAQPRVKIVNAFSADEVISEGLNTTEGEESFMNFVRSNSSSIRAALES